MPHGTEQADGVDGSRPEWFAAFLADRGTRKPSAHTLKAYRQDFDAIAALIAGGQVLPGVALGSITIDTMRTAFARYAQTHEAALIQRCWSTWNVLCTYLYTAELIGSNPMPRHRPDRGALLNHPGFRAHLPLRGPLSNGADLVPLRWSAGGQCDRDPALYLDSLLRRASGSEPEPGRTTVARASRCFG